MSAAPAAPAAPLYSAAPSGGVASLGPAASFAADLWDAPRAQRPEWAAVLAGTRALSEGSPSTVQALTDGAAQALLRGGGGASTSAAGRGRASRFPVFLSSTFVGEPRGKHATSYFDPLGSLH